MSGKRTVVITRPQGENETLAEKLNTQGYNCLIHPLISLLVKPVDAVMKNIAMDLDRYDKIIFVSKSSVKFGVGLLETYWPQWPIKLAWYAVGAGTAAELAEFGVKALYPEVPGSEGLLELPGLQALAGEHVLIVRGQGGRELIGQSLKESGATVTYLETYERQLLQYDFSDLTADTVVVLTSAEILENFASQVGHAAGQLHVVVPSFRIEGLARAHGFRSVTNAGGASDEALYDAVIKAGNPSGSVNE